jgi:hypothetical protein
MGLEEIVWVHGLDFSLSAKGQLASCCEEVNITIQFSKIREISSVSEEL